MAKELWSYAREGKRERERECVYVREGAREARRDTARVSFPPKKNLRFVLSRGMASRDELVSQFADVTGVEAERAQFYLESSAWQLEVRQHIFTKTSPPPPSSSPERIEDLAFFFSFRNVAKLRLVFLCILLLRKISEILQFDLQQSGVWSRLVLSACPFGKTTGYVSVLARLTFRSDFARYFCTVFARFASITPRFGAIATIIFIVWIIALFYIIIITYIIHTFCAITSMSRRILRL